MVPPKRTANLPAMPFKNIFLSVCIPIPRTTKYRLPRILSQLPSLIAIFFLPAPLARLESADGMPHHCSQRP
jgi:hypothetical protein